jgi:hypothetical protein
MQFFESRLNVSSIPGADVALDSVDMIGGSQPHGGCAMHHVNFSLPK